MTPRRQSAVDGGRPLGIPLPGLRVGELTYHQVKARLGLLQPAEPGPTTREQRQFVGGDPVMADLRRPGPGGWRQPHQLPAWTPRDLLDEYDEPSDLKILLSIGTTRRLEVEA